MSGEGAIVIICRKCGYKYHVSLWGERRERSHYAGPPEPKRILYGYSYVCPACGAEALEVPARVRILSAREFDEKCINGRWRVIC